MTVDLELEIRRLRDELPNPPRRRLIREVAGVTQDAVAEDVGVDRATISRWESGDREPRDCYLAKYSAVLAKMTAAAAA
jgi:transcriptional regulator with XRE-family HTH domain